MTASLAKCPDCDWFWPPMGADPDLEILPQMALLVHAWSTHPDQIHERTGLRRDLIDAGLKAALSQWDSFVAAGDEDLAGLAVNDLNLIGFAWLNDREMALDAVKQLTPAGLKLLKEANVEVKAWAQKQAAEATP